MSKNSTPGTAPRRHPLEHCYSSDAFAGTAEFYARFRVPYPDDLLNELRLRAGISGNGRLLDLACGTGQVALAMHLNFREVLAVDQEREMIAVGRRLSDDLGATNISWIVQRAEEFDSESGSFELITIGSAFHRLNRRLVGRKAMELLIPGCCLAVMGSNSLWTGDEEWQSIARDIVRSWKSKAVVDQNASIDQPMEAFEESLETVGFEEIGSSEFLVPHSWSFETFCGYVYSLSGMSKQSLGQNVPKFESELKESLLSNSLDGTFRENVKFHLILMRKPLA